MREFSRWIISSFPIIGILILLELLSRSEVIDPFLIPAPSKVFGTLTSGAFLSASLPQTGLTFLRAAVGYLIAIIIAIPLGIAMGRSHTIYRFTSPLVELLRPLPSSAIIPVALLFLGIGSQMKIAVIAFGSLWPILVSTIEGAKNIDSVLLDTTHLLRLNFRRRVVGVYLPAAAIHIAAGMRTSLAVSLILAVTAEMIVGINGLGFFIIDMERAFRIQEMYAAIIILGLLGYFLNEVFLRLQRKALYWV